MTTFFVPTDGNWSGGGKAVLDNFRYAAARHPELSFERGDIAVVNRNFPARGHKGPFVLVPQNAWAWYGPKNGPREHVKLATMRLVSEIAMRRAVGVIRAGRSIPERGRCWDGILPNPLDEGFDAADLESRALPRPSEVPYIVSVGSLNSYRGVDFLIGEYARYRAAGGARELQIVGGGQPHYVARIQELVRATDGVHLHSEKVTRLEVLAWLRNAECAVLPSYVETSPMSLLEALAVQHNVIASDIAGHPDIVPAGVSGPRYFSHDRPGELAALLSRFPASGAPYPLSDAEFRESERRRWSEQLVEVLHALIRPKELA